MQRCLIVCNYVQGHFLRDMLLAAVANENFPICMFHRQYFGLCSQIKEDEVF